MGGCRKPRLSAIWAFAMIFGIRSVFAQTAPPVIPLTPGLTFVLAVHAPKPAAAGSRIAQGDYEMVVAIAGVSPSGIEESTRIEAVDESRQPIQVTIRRRVLAADLVNSRLQILGFHTDDPSEISGTTSLGPSVAVMRDLRTNGRASYSVRNFRHLSTSTGVLTLAASQPVPFPVLLNGRRVELPALRVTGQLKYADKVRPWEQYLFDHPQHPITLRFAHGAVNEGIPFNPEATREVVRIDFPVPNERQIEEALNKECRVEVPGIYFDFDRDTLKPESTPALRVIADLLRRQPQWSLSIEGHTDNVGSDSYNQDLSTRRAAAVKTALVRDFAVSPGRLSSAGFGERRPVEPNDTIAGRARNRRVELVRDCSGKP
jgi:outer membrane protein OmpA-like peptidoglycan-associated protein